MRIGVFGIGYVGAVSAVCLARDGHDVIAVDPSPDKVAAINEGGAPIYEQGLTALVAETMEAGKLQATLSAAEAIANTDLCFVCVGTPSLPDGSIDLSSLKQACADIGTALQKKKTYYTVVLRSTMLPGTAQNICLPIVEEKSHKAAGRDFGFAVNPEFLREGSAIGDYDAPPKIVVGAWDERSGRTIMALYSGINAPRFTTTIRIAESIKYADNAWHALKVAFANEMGNVLKEAGVDSHRVMDIFCADQKLNLSPAYLKPGFAFGGSCLPKDVDALRAMARTRAIPTPLLDALGPANDRQIERALGMIDATGRRKIALLGLAFKPGTDDLRGSPLVTLAGELINRGYDLTIYDPALEGRDAGTLSDYLVHDEKKIGQQADIYVLGHNTPHFRNILAALSKPDTPVIDLVRGGAAIERRKNYDGICW